MIDTMRNVKNFLQGLGIMYIDWKLDNIRISNNGEYKLFDFNCSELKTNKWIIEPVNCWSYKKAKENGLSYPQQIDDWLFDL